MQKFRDLTGQKFNKLTAVRFIKVSKSAVWLFKCDCGKEKQLHSYNVTGGGTKTCGCIFNSRQITVKCDFCGKQFNVNKARTKYSQSICCSRQCADALKKGKLFAKREKANCENCGKLFEFTLKSRKKGRFCSKQCTYHFNTKIRENIQIVCMSCEKTFAQREGSYVKKHCSAKCLSQTQKRNRTGCFSVKRVQKSCEWCKTEIEVRETESDRKRFCSRKCKSSFLTLTMGKTSNLEVKMATAFRKNNLEFIQHYPISYWIPDFALPKLKLVVECDGKYWHSLPEVKERDFLKNKDLTELGWTIIRLKEDEINQSLEKCISKVKDVIKVLEKSQRGVSSFSKRQCCAERFRWLEK